MYLTPHPILNFSTVPSISLLHPPCKQHCCRRLIPPTLSPSPSSSTPQPMIFAGGDESAAAPPQAVLDARSHGEHVSKGPKRLVTLATSRCGPIISANPARSCGIHCPKYPEICDALKRHLKGVWPGSREQASGELLHQIFRRLAQMDNRLPLMRTSRSISRYPLTPSNNSELRSPRTTCSYRIGNTPGSRDLLRLDFRHGLNMGQLLQVPPYSSTSGETLVLSAGTHDGATLWHS